jgi:capsular exopolysaccharide synthesis family protein
MDLRDYLRAIRKRWWMVVGALAASIGVAVTVTVLTPPQYAASVTFFVSSRGSGVTDAFQGGLFVQQRVKSYVDVLTSNRLAQAIVAKQPDGLSADTVQAGITAEVVPDTVLVRATVTDGDRARALRIAQALAIEFPELVRTLETPPKGTAATVGVQIIAEPRLADSPVAPQPFRNIGLGAVLGLIIGAGAAALRESLDTSVRSAEMLAKATGAPVLSAIPFDPKAEKSPLIIEGSAQSTRAEAMRQLRTNLQFVNVDRPIKTLVVTSAVPGEGKSSTSINLGIAFAEAGKRVILIDADLRRPKVAEYLGLEGAVGLTNLLAGQVQIGDALQPWGGSGLWVLPSGSVPPNPSELLASRNMADLLAALASGFDMVIIDTPPLLPVTDAAVMSTVADGCLLVSRFGKTTVSQAAAAAAALTAVNGKLHGCVLNRSPKKSGGDYSYYSYMSEATPVAAVGSRPAAGTSLQRVADTVVSVSPAPQVSAPVSPALVSPAPVSPAPVSPGPRASAPVSAAPYAAASVSPAPHTPEPRRPQPTHRAVGQVRRAELEMPTGEIIMPTVYRSNEATYAGHPYEQDSFDQETYGQRSYRQEPAEIDDLGPVTYPEGSYRYDSAHPYEADFRPGR